MKAVVLHEYGGPDKLMYEDVPDPVAADGQVLVRVAASSVNPIDYKLRSGAMKNFYAAGAADDSGKGYRRDCAGGGQQGEWIQARR